MSFPSAKILVYDTSDNLEYTITGDIISAVASPTITEGVGSFSFMLPGKKGHSYVYDDIGNFYKVKMYMGYGSLDEDDLVLAGRILRIDSYMGQQGKGFYRVFSGKDLGEILERRVKPANRFEGQTVNSLAAFQVADELSILDPDKIEDDETTITVGTEGEPYLSFLQKLSDFWVDSSTKIQKDWYVDAEGELVWGSRPLRSSGTETLTAAGATPNILSYKLTLDITPVKNRITVYGAPCLAYPLNYDTFTEALSGEYRGQDWEWTADNGSLQRTATYGTKEGAYAIACSDISSPGTADFTLALPIKVTPKSINKLQFWFRPLLADSAYVRLNAPDASNYFEAELECSSTDWQSFSESIALADDDSSNVWSRSGSPNWWNIRAVRFYVTGTYGASMAVDKLYFSPDRPFAVAENATSQTYYGMRELEVTDESLLTEDECQQRAETLALQLGQRVTALEVELIGNNNVKPGDRCTVTLPAENITSLPFDVVSVTHSFSSKPLGYRTNARLIYGADSRAVPPATPAEAAQRSLRRLQQVASGVYTRIVR